MANTKEKITKFEEEVGSDVCEMRKEIERLKREYKDLSEKHEETKRESQEKQTKLVTQLAEKEAESKKLRKEKGQKRELQDGSATVASASTSNSSPASELLIKGLVDALNERSKRDSLMELPEFNGDFKKWNHFKSVFYKTSEEAKFSDLENLNRLQKALKGDALECVSGLMLDAQNIEGILQRLEKEFGTPDLIYSALLKELLAVENPTMQKPKGFITFMHALNNLVINMNTIGEPEYLNDQRLLKDLENKIPTNLKHKWYNHILADNENYGRSKLRTLEDFAKWLKPTENLAIMLTADVANDVVNSQSHQHNQQLGHRNFRAQPRQQFQANIQSQPRRRMGCLICGQNHRTTECFQFQNMSVERRWETVRRLRICTNCCNQSNHDAQNCFLPPQCRQYGCRARHHTLLHRATPTGLRQVENVNTHHGSDLPELYFQIIPVTLRHKNREVDTFAFMDTGSSASLIHRELKEELQVNGSPRPFSLAWTNGSIQDEPESETISILVKDQDGKFINLNGLRTVESMVLPKQTVDGKELRRKYRHLRGINLQSYRDGAPKLIIGLPHAHLMCALQTRTGRAGEPIAIRTHLGWVLLGSNDLNSKQAKLFSLIEAKHANKDIANMMRNYFSTEDFGVKLGCKIPQPKDEEKAKQIMEKTLKKTGTGYEIGLLWKTEDVSLPESYGQALRRLQSLERKLARDEMLKKWYHEEIDAYCKKGYARPIGQSEVNSDEFNPKINYIPHFAVVNYNKPVPNPRLVFDAAAKNNGISLNSQLLSGPDAVASLFGILIRFREGRIGISGDIKEMFHQVKIRQDDRCAQRFLYRREPFMKPEIYEMRVMTFGATCSPACAQYVKNENASLFQNQYPSAVVAIIHNHYVDDYLDSFDNEDTAVNRTRQVIEIHDKANFFIRNFISNSNEVLKSLPPGRVSENTLIKIGEKDENFDKILGQWWDREEDALKYVPKGLYELGGEVTKRMLLSNIMKIYDPLGLIANYIIESKILMQDIWKQGLDWDAKLPRNLADRWQEWVERMKGIENIKIPRCYSVAEDVAKREFHVFVDASEKAFAAVVYMRTIHQQGIDICIVAAKSRVAPTKPLSIPRLELQAAVLGARLAETLRREMRIDINETCYWTDSKTVLAWISSEPRNYKQFVALRIGEILNRSGVNQWHWIGTKDNPADEATKVIKGPSIWFEGPSFLKASYIQYDGFEPTTLEEIRPVHTINAVNRLDWEVINVKWSSNWLKLRRAIAICLKYLEWLKAKVNNNSFSPIISKGNLDKAEHLLFKKAQWEGFSDEMAALAAGHPISNRSDIKNLCPVLDENNVMRAESRLTRAQFLGEDTKRPIILPKHNYITTLIIRYYHEKYLHRKTETVIAAIRQRFWVVDLRATLKRVVTYCQKCKNDRAKPQPPMMAPLPACRTTPFVKPFTHTGADYFGPLTVYIGRRSEKRWCALFTCLSTRAVHLELASDLSANSFLICLRAMQHRRGKIAHLYCDNGTNFVGACREITRLQEKCATEGIYFHFNPPAAPHFGGSWERMVQEVKSLLSLCNEPYQEAVLRSALTEIEFMINNRPLTHIPLDHEDDEPLTPNHFLIGCSGEAEPTQCEISEAEALKTHWKKSQWVAQKYWSRWIKEFLPRLVTREKWLKPVKELRIGDIVAFPDEQTRGRWRKGIITQVQEGKDKQVRSVTIRVGSLFIRRPAVKVARLEVAPKKK